MNFNVVDILNTGVTGFAFLMLYLGYRLTANVQNKILEKNTDEFKDVEIFREWKDLVRSQVSNTRFFMLFSLLFFAGGLSLMVIKAESKIILSVTPSDNRYLPLVHHQSERLKLSDTGRIELMVQDEHNISFSADKMIKEIDQLKSQNKELIVSSVSNTDDAGF